MCLSPVYVKGIPCACGKCIECLMFRSNEWSFRIMNEASLYQDNCFITLTYNEDNLPQEGFLVKRDLQLFVKRLRKELEPLKIRYFACGEYGSKGKRPHYHIIIFGWKPPDLMFFKIDKSGEPIFRSSIIEKLWKNGFSSIGELTKDSAKYCAKYLQKLNVIDNKPMPFTLMSKKPAIGVNSINSNMINTDKVYANGKYIKLPRSYLRFLEKSFPELVSNIKLKRLKNSFSEFKKFLDGGGFYYKDALKGLIFYRDNLSIDSDVYSTYIEKRKKKFIATFEKIIANKKSKNKNSIEYVKQLKKIINKLKKDC